MLAQRRDTTSECRLLRSISASRRQACDDKGLDSEASRFETESARVSDTKNILKGRQTLIKSVGFAIEEPRPPLSIPADSFCHNTKSSFAENHTHDQGKKEACAHDTFGATTPLKKSYKPKRIEEYYSTNDENAMRCECEGANTEPSRIIEGVKPFIRPRK